MTLNIGGAVNTASDWICSSSIIRKVMENPIFTGLLLTALVMIVIMAQYHYKIKEEGNTKLAKTTIYLFLIVMGIMFVHNYAFKRCSEKEAHQNGIRNVFSSIEHSRNLPTYQTVPVLPYAASMYSGVPTYAAPTYTTAPTPMYTAPNTLPQVVENPAQPNLAQPNVTQPNVAQSNLTQPITPAEGQTMM
jgi:hypothetical protein